MVFVDGVHQIPTFSLVFFVEGHRHQKENLDEGPFYE
jgi:hypothetical protein